MTALPNNAALPEPSGRTVKLNGPRSLEIAKGKTAQEGAETKRSGPAFRVLLEQLQEKAAALQETSKDVEDPAELRGAVDTARATLEDALFLGDQVLEAFRSARVTEGVANDVAKGAKSALNDKEPGSQNTPGPRAT